MEARNVKGEQNFFYPKNLLITEDELKKYLILPRINAVLAQEFETKEAYSDEEIRGRVPSIARRTVTKYRSALESYLAKRNQSPN